ncbi:MAG: hypothetical protein ACJASG_000956 [Oleiphilaceae bacterium]|jgi:hypothetical protein
MSIQTQHSFISPSTSNSTNTQVQKTIQATNTSTGAAETVNKESDIKLSSRAHKVQMLNEEFFPGGPSSVTITPEFIERLYEYGFISESEASKFSNNDSVDKKASGTLGELSADIKDLNDRLKNDNPEDSLIDILTRADAIINNLNGSKPSPLTNNIKLVSAELNAYLGSADVKQLSDIETKSMGKLSLALSIADKLNPNNISSQQLNSYLSFA